MERQVKELKIDAWKMYTGAELGEKAWFLDDEKVAYPFWERTQKLGIKNLCVHKGLPLGAFNEKACTPLDLEKAAKDWPDLNFIVYHSGYPRHRLARPRHRRARSSTRRPTTRRRSPGSATSSASSSRTRRSRTSTSSWAARSSSSRRATPTTLPAHARPDDPGRRRRPHPLGHRLDLGRQPAEPDRAAAPAEDEADELIEKYKYPELTDEVKDQIFGLNAAKLFGIDPKAKRAGDQGRQADAAPRGVPPRPARRATRSTAGSGSGRQGEEPTIPIGT